MSRYSIKAEHLGKQYRIVRGRRRVLLQDVLQNAIASGIDIIRPNPGVEAEQRPRFGGQKFWALEDVSFEIAAGESIGIVGNNGAGKTTLLKILARVTAPTVGRVRLRGRVASLLEVGTGFHPELTGRENVYLNGAVLGMRRREIDRKFDEIVDFSGVEEFLETPVKFYSSGMRMRLAFSVAAHLEPEILLVDEVLAVGDAAFQRKSLNKMGNVIGHGRTVLFVSHNMAAVRALCKSAIHIDQGRVVCMGNVNDVLEAYINADRARELAAVEFEEDESMKTQVLSVALEDEDSNLVTSIPHDRPFWARLKVAVRTPIYRGHLELHILDSDLATVLTVRDIDEAGVSAIAQAAGTYTYRVRFPAPSLVPGKYSLGVEVVNRRRGTPKTVDRVASVWPFEIYDNGSMLSRANVRWSGKFILSTEWRRIEG